LTQRGDGPAYLVLDAQRIAALHATDLSDAAVHSPELALTIAKDNARRRGLDASHAAVAGLAPYDQWTVSGSFASHRPLYRIALNDDPGTELYVSSTTGEIVLDTTRRQRAWNYVGSIAHWIYPAVLRSHPAAWSTLLRWLSLLALIGASAGAVLGTLRIAIARLRPVPPYRGLQAWHHWLGLACMTFVLTWIFSGWLSMDDGRLFTNGKAAEAEALAISGALAWQTVPRDDARHVSAPVSEVEWFAFGGQIYRRERTAFDRQQLSLAGAGGPTAMADRVFLRPAEIDAAASHLARPCDASFTVEATDAYAVASSMPGAPVFRVVCGRDWFDIDGSDGTVLDKLDPSRRVYRWLYAALHTLDFPVLTARPTLRAALIVVLCACGFVFSLTGVVIAWRRLMSCFFTVERS
jgi:hypothetical protein